MPARPESLTNTGLMGIFTKNSVKAYLESYNQRHFQNPANPRGSPHCGLPRPALAQKSANAFLLLLLSSSAEPRKFPPPENPPDSGLESPLWGRDATPPRRRPHSGLQGRTRGFCRLCRQLLLCAVTLGGHLREVQLVLVVPCQRLLHRQQRIEQ